MQSRVCPLFIIEIDMYKISKYSRVFDDIDDDIVIYNTINRSLIALSRSYFIDNYTLVDNIPEDEIDTLRECGFFVDRIDYNALEQHYETVDTLIISLETLLSCNLSCPYCYQIGNDHSKSIIKRDSLDLLYEYVKKVNSITHLKFLTLKVLGGEPSVNWGIADYIIEKLYNFCQKNGITFNLMVDTNCTLIEDYLQLKHYDSVLFTVPLTYKECHNAFRHYRSGAGTYDEIIENVNRLHQSLKNCSIVFRYNMDASNIGKFSDYIQDLKKRVGFTPIISPNYTLNLGCGTFQNELSHDDFIKWCSSDFIDLMVDAGWPIVITPVTLSSKCQYRQKYSLKLFSDGTVGACAMNFFDKTRPTLKEVVDNLDHIDEYWNNAKGYSLLSQKKCRTCSSLFLCAGAYTNPCIKSLNLQECIPDRNIGVDLKLFLQHYVKYSNAGYDDLFVGFNDYNTYK